MKLGHWGRIVLLAAALLGSCGLAWLLLPEAGLAKLLLFACLVLFLAEFFCRMDRWLARRAGGG